MKPEIQAEKPKSPLCKLWYLKGKREGYEQGKQAQYVETINLFNDLRNKRFQFNDEVKMVIDMLKDEMTRRLKSQLKEVD